MELPRGLCRMWGVMRGSSECGVGGVVTVVLWNMVLPEDGSQEVSAHFGVRESLWKSW